MSKKLLVIVTFLIAAAPVLTVAQGQSQGRGRGNSGSSGNTTSSSTPDVAVSATVVFNDGDRTRFRDYFATHKIAGKPLPPGIAKNVARGKALPPGIAKQALPQDLVVALGPRAKGITFTIVGDRVVAERAGLVVDILLNVFK